LGGDGKGQDFTPLADPVQRYARAVVLMGQDATRIQEALAHTDVPLHHANTLEAAVHKCFGLAKPGDVVLLSPACASMDMFRNYAHRAEVFVHAVQDLVQEWGGIG
jgi:UDP-N-acetylmuramoylalanine--D-glutamate ligase